MSEEKKPLDTQALLKVLGEIIPERERQHARFGEQNRNPLEWLGILSEEVGEVSREVVDYYFENGLEFLENETKEKVQNGRLINYRAELIQVAAVAIQAVECLDRETNRKNATVYEFIPTGDKGILLNEWVHEGDTRLKIEEENGNIICSSKSNFKLIK